MREFPYFIHEKVTSDKKTEPGGQVGIHVLALGRHDHEPRAETTDPGRGARSTIRRTRPQHLPLVVLQAQLGRALPEDPELTGGITSPM